MQVLKTPVIHAHVTERLDSTNNENALTRAHTYTHTRAYINVYEYIYTEIHIYIHIHIHMHLYMYACIHIYVRIHMHTYVQIENLSNNALNVSSNMIDAHTHPYAYACIYTNSKIYTYVHNLQRVYSQMCTLEFPAQKCRLIENQSHETGSLSEKVHGCHILP